MVETQAVAVFSCEKGEGVEDPSPVSVGTLDSDDFSTEGGAEVDRICTSMIREARKRNYNSSETKNARTHEFTQGATDGPAPVEGVDLPIRDVLDEIRSDTSLEENGAIISQLYLDQVHSRADLLIIAHYKENGEDFVAILKTPYLEGAHEIDVSASDATEVFIENERVIQEETDKSVLYPRYDPYEEEIDDDKAHLFQANGASNYATYWYAFLKLAEQKHPDEVVEKKMKHQAQESESGAAYETYQEFLDRGPVIEEDDDLPTSSDSGGVTVRIAGRSLRVSLEELRSSNNVQLARDGDQYYLLLSGLEPDITVGSGKSKKSVFSDLSDVPDIQDII